MIQLLVDEFESIVTPHASSDGQSLTIDDRSDDRIDSIYIYSIEN